MGRNRTEGRGHKDFKKGGKLGQGVGALKREPGAPLRNMPQLFLQKLPILQYLNHNVNYPHGKVVLEKRKQKILHQKILILTNRNKNRQDSYKILIFGGIEGHDYYQRNSLKNMQQTKRKIRCPLYDIALQYFAVITLKQRGTIVIERLKSNNQSRACFYFF